MLRLFPEKSVCRKKVLAIKNLPQPNHSLIQIVSILQQEDISLNQLVAAIRKDQVLVARILRLVNSSYYSLRHKIDSVASAVTLLGLINIKNIVYSAICFDYFSDDEKEEWEHAFTTSLFVSDLMRKHYIPAESNLQLTALIHDIGKVVFRRKYSKLYKRAINSARKEGFPAFVKERLIMHHDHAEVASWLLEAWDMPDDIIIPIAYHHREDCPEEYALETAVLKLADWVDSMARRQLMPLPSFELLEPYGIFETDKENFIHIQKGLINSIKENHIQEALAS